ncbi:hypothetical protein HM131_08585 [Halobacillus mangrovi]|uniref:Glycosyl-hydrolase 97 C-terminal oligomerisation domain-containing protein n=2 Tax=Halobacillus mangrovi TaxID=402384 RepID=A0A1W5ZUA9_9BACI|nr:hypothetical protein HM131_08585 [Halobacillus mangrovi]
MVPNAEIGDYATIVRRSGDEFYMGSITDEKARDLDVDLDFLDKDKKYVAEVYSDAHNVDLEENPEAVSIQKVIVSHKDTLVTSMATGGGQAVRMYPASKEERKDLPKYKDPKLKLSYGHVPEAIQSNDEFQVTAEAENNSEVVTGKKVQLMVNGKLVAEEKIRIAPHSTKEVTLSYDKLFEPGKYKVQVDGLSVNQVEVNEKEPTFEYSDLSVTADGERIMAEAAVTNFGTTSGTTTVPFTVNGEEVETKDVEVPAQAGGGTQKVTFTYDTNGKADAYNVSIGNLVPEPIAMPLINLAGNWLFQKGDNETWKSPEFNDTNWQEVTLPRSWEDHSNYLEDDTYGWYRKAIHIPKEWKGYSLKVKLGKIDDVDQTFMNGQIIGESGTFPMGEGEQGMISAWDWEREYTIPADIIKYGEENLISIRVFGAKGGGRLYDGPLGQIELVKVKEDVADYNP